MSELVLIANSDDGTISALRLDRQPKPRLSPLTTTQGLPGCSTFAVSGERTRVYATYNGQTPGIATLKLDAQTGELTELSRREVPGKLVYLQLTSDGSNLLGASYHDGFGAVWPVTSQGLDEPHSRFEYANLHAIVSAANFVYAPSLGDDLVAQFRLTEGRLEPLDPPTVPAPAGSGPRHLVVEGPNAYLLTEFSGELIRYAVTADGRLVEAERSSVIDPASGLATSRYGADPRAEQLIWCADVHVTNSLAVTSERTGSTLTSTRLGPDGSLQEPLAFTPTEEQPRGFAITSDGELLVSVGERSDQASLHAVRPDGSLPCLDRAQIGNGANWVRIV